MTEPIPGIAATIAPGLRRVLAPNPSPMTHWGTNTFLLGEKDLAVIDPGPDDPSHLAAILGAVLPGQQISHILVTHAHLDHSPLAAQLSSRTGAPVLGFGKAQAGRSALMQALAARDETGGGEGVDLSFCPDITLADGDVITGHNWHLTAMHTPGHFAGHLSFAWRNSLFCGDHIMGWASSLVSPPDGDMGAYIASLTRLAATSWHHLYPAHGATISDPATRIAFLIAHRRTRESAILQALDAGPASSAQLTSCIYTDTPNALLRAAERNCFAHLIDLQERKVIEARPHLSFRAIFARI